MDVPIDDFVTGTQLKLKGNEIQTKYGGALEGMREYAKDGKEGNEYRDSVEEPSTASINEQEYRSQHGGHLHEIISDFSLYSSQSSDIDVKKVDEWLKERSFVFEMKHPEEDLFDDEHVKTSDHVIDLFSSNSVKDIQDTLPFCADTMTQEDKLSKETIVNLFLNNSSDNTPISLLERPPSSLSEGPNPSSDFVTHDSPLPSLERSCETPPATLSFSACGNIALTSEERACLEELERGSQLSQEEQEMLEDSKKEFEFHERDRTSLMTNADLENLPEGLGLVFESMPTEADTKKNCESNPSVALNQENIPHCDNVTKLTEIVAVTSSETVQQEQPPSHSVTVLSFMPTKGISQKMQILVNTDQGQQIYEINADILSSSVGSNPVTLPITVVPEVNLSSCENLKEVTSNIQIHNEKVGPTMEQSNVIESSLKETEEVTSQKNEKSKNTAITAIAQSLTPLSDANQNVSISNPKQKVKKKHSLSEKKKDQIIKEDGSRPFKCPIDGCEWAFGKEYRLKRHLESHEGKKKFICDHQGCNRQFSTIYNLNAHKKLHKRPDSIQCPAKDCGQLFPTRHKMEQHLSVHKEVQAPYKCPYENCGKEYYFANSVASHVRVHKYNEDDFTCPYEGCRKVFDKICRLKQHVRYHTGERPYVCEYEGCGWAFMNASKLTRHMQKHTGERKFACSEPGCGKLFMRLEHLKGHRIIHTGDKPFVCPHENCAARFAAKSSLYVHLKKHNGTIEKLVYPCPLASCDKKYNCKASLRLHMLKVHMSVLEGGQQDAITLSSKELQEIESMDGLTPELTNSIPLAQVLGGTITTDLLAQQVTNNTATQLVIPELVIPNYTTTSDGSIATNQTLSAILNQGLGITISPNELEVLASSRILQENNSGSARTDYCSNHIVSSRAKKWWLLQQQQLKTNVVTSSAEGSCLSDGIKNTSDPNQILQDTSPSVSTDVMLASAPLNYRNPIGGTQFVQTYILPDEIPSSSDMYQDDHILTPVTNSSLISELPVPVCLLSDSAVVDASSSATDFGVVPSGDTEFPGSTINLQDLE